MRGNNCSQEVKNYYPPLQLL